MKMLKTYVDILQSIGKFYFTIDELIKKMSTTKGSALTMIHRLKKKNQLASPAKGFYIIIPPQYRRLKCLPASMLIPIIMEHLKIDYYACLLTASLYHGASHQKPQKFQIITTKQMKNLTCGEIYIEFIYKKKINNLPIEQRTVDTGYLKISSPELTMIDLLLYPHKSGGLNHIATILTELIEAINISKIKDLIDKIKPKNIFQKLGYILENIETEHELKKQEIIKIIFDSIQNNKLRYYPLEPSLSTKGKIRNEKWKIIENTTIETDII